MSCDEKLCPILKMTGEEKKREIRGLRWCSSTKCRTLMNRDLNAALNILSFFRSGTNRPNSLSRNSGEIKDNSKKKEISEMELTTREKGERIFLRKENSISYTNFEKRRFKCSKVYIKKMTK